MEIKFTSERLVMRRLWVKSHLASTDLSHALRLCVANMSLEEETGMSRSIDGPDTSFKMSSIELSIPIALFKYQGSLWPPCCCCPVSPPWSEAPPFPALGFKVTPLHRHRHRNQSRQSSSREFRPRSREFLYRMEPQAHRLQKPRLW